MERRKFYPLVLVAAGLCVYHNSLHGAFIFDDSISIVDNPHIRQLWPLTEAMSAPPQSPVAGRPIISLTLALNCAISGLNPWSYHAFNLAMHILNALVLFGIVRQTLERGRLKQRFGSASPWLAFAVALVWVVHPLLTDAVNYITQRTELVVSLFLLLTLYCVILGHDSIHRRRWHTVAIVCCALGMASKEVMVTAPVLVLLYDRVLLSNSWADVFRQRRRLHAGLACTWMILAWLMVSGPRTMSVGLGFENLTPWEYARTQCGVILHYLRLAIWPHPLVIDYDDWPVVRTVSAALPDLAVLMALAGATLWALKRWPAVGFLAAWFFVILAPTSSFVPIVSEVAAERRMYLPLAGVVTLAVVAAYTMFESLFRKPAARYVEGGSLMMIVAVLGYATMQRNKDYRSELAIWTDAVAKRPTSARAHTNLGVVLSHEGNDKVAIQHYLEALRLRPDYAYAHSNLGASLASGGKIKEALAQYTVALRLDPSFAGVHYNLGVALAGQGKTNAAIASYRRALQIQSELPNAQYNLAVALAGEGKTAEAIDHYRQALLTKPDDADVHYNLGVALAREGRVADAITHYTTALRLNPNRADAHNNLGIALASSGRITEATSHFSEAIRLKPDDPEPHNNLASVFTIQHRTSDAIEQYRAALRLRPDWPEPLTSLAWILATNENPESRNPSDAVQMAERASELTGHQQPAALDTLAAAYAAAGRFTEAVETARKAIELAQASGQLDLANSIQQRVQLYQAGRPFHENETAASPQT